jgi:hypothetical protein
MQHEAKAYLWDIANAAESIRAFTDGKDLNAYQQDELLRAGVERKFGIIGEALSQLLRYFPQYREKITLVGDIGAKPELQCSVLSYARSPLPGGRVDLTAVASRYIDSGFALFPFATKSFTAMLRCGMTWCGRLFRSIFPGCAAKWRNCLQSRRSKVE